MFGVAASGCGGASDRSAGNLSPEVTATLDNTEPVFMATMVGDEQEEHSKQQIGAKNSHHQLLSELSVQQRLWFIDNSTLSNLKYDQCMGVEAF
ncbi:hypothetical protein SRHO_G00057500 [Serrasalmus rhombeus]